MTATDLTAGAIWVIIVTVAVGSFALRSSLIVLFGWVGELPARPRAALRFVPAAVLAGIAFQPSCIWMELSC